MVQHIYSIGAAVALSALLGACGPRGGYGYNGGSYGYQGQACADGARCDRDDNPPGARGGPGTNWENPRGSAGGSGASPNRRDDDRPYYK
jgi:hypothetical protein